MRKIWAADTDLGVIHTMALASEARQQIRPFTVNDMKEEDSVQTFRNTGI